MSSYRIPLMKPYISPRARTLIGEVLDSGFLTEGPVTNRFCEAVCRYTGASYGVAFNSCTTALETALRMAGIGPGDEVIVPDFTYPATAQAVLLTGARPVIVDVHPDTMLIDGEAARKAVTTATRAIMPVSLFGNPLDHDFLFELRKEHEMLVIEDAACALGSSFRGEATGRQSDMTAFSFHPRKFITTGEGGVVVTPHEEWARALQQYKHFGLVHSPETGGPVFQSVGTNYKMSDLLAALGVAQMEEIDLLLEQRQRLAAGYDRMLKESKNVRLPQTTPHGSHSYQSYVVKVPRRDEVMKQMRSRGVEVQIGTYALHRQPLFQNGHARLMGPFPGSMEAFSRSLALPLFHGMTDAEQKEVVEILMQCVE